MNRDEIAVHIMAALVSAAARAGVPRPGEPMHNKDGTKTGQTTEIELARAAYIFADALIAEGSKPSQKQLDSKT